MMGTTGELAKIVGKKNVSNAKEDLLAYAHDYSLVSPGMADVVVWPKNSGEISKIVHYCNKNNIPLIPVSSKVHFNGCTIPKQGGIVLDMTRMNSVLEVDTYNRKVKIEPGVTWGQITNVLNKKGMRIMMPLLPHPERSVLTDFLEREVPTNTVFDYGEPVLSMEVVWPTGEIFRTGSASVTGYPDSPAEGMNPSGPGLDFYRLLQGAQGTMGVVTWMILKIESVPSIDRIFFAPVDDIAYVMEFLHRILPRRIGQECLLLNNIDMATVIAEHWPEDFEKLSLSLPSWTLILVLSGLKMRPEEKMAYEENFLNQVLRNEFKDIALTDNLPQFPGLGRKLLKMLREPWMQHGIYRKNLWKGGCQDITFITKSDKVELFIDIVEGITALHGYPSGSIGGYIQPIEHNRACQMEFSLFYNPFDDVEKAAIRSMFKDAVLTLMNEGAFFTRPYGEIAPIVYERTAGYTIALQRVKKIFDPKNIMNPGNLCF